MNWAKLTDVIYLIFRVVIGFLFFQHGAQKLFGAFGGLPEGMTIEFMSQAWIGGVLEAFGLFIVLGLFTRPVAFLQSGMMAVAYFQFHQPGGFWPIQNHGEPAVLYCFIFLLIFALGGGPYSLDRLIHNKVRNRFTSTVMA